MIEFISSPENIPFTAAIALMLAIALLEGITTVIGMGLFSMLDDLVPEIDLEPGVDLDANADTGVDINTGPSIFTKFLSWILVGKVPLLILVIVALTSFGIIGFILQSAFKFFLGFYLPWFIAVIPAFLIALPIIRLSAKLFSKIIPDDDTSAISQESLIGQIATLTSGIAEIGKPAEAKLKDKFGQTHYLMVEPDIETETFIQQDKILLVSRKGSIYKGIKNTNSLLTDK